ncbi:uncharacterized protein V6R79_008743 [Siganus canaliculatus]
MTDEAPPCVEEAASTGALAVVSEEVLGSQWSVEGNEMEYETRKTELNSLEEMNSCLDKTFSKSVKMSNYVNDTDKFVSTNVSLTAADDYVTISVIVIQDAFINIHYT